MKKILLETLNHWKTHNATRMGAALAYYAMLSFVPLLLLLISGTALLFTKDIVENSLIAQLVTTIGSTTTLYISEILQNTSINSMSLWSVLLSGTVLIIGAFGVFNELNRDLDELWEVKEKKPHKKSSFFKNILSLLYEKIAILSIIPILALLLVISIAITTFLSVLQSNALGQFRMDFIITILQIIIPLILSTSLFTLVYRILPSHRLPWRVLSIGGFATAVLFSIGNTFITLYISLLVHTSIFGSASSLVGLLVWIYYSAQVFFFGASFTFVFAKSKKLIPFRDS